MAVPIVDLFAGPGGLSEGFETYRSGRSYPFRCVLSIEKEEDAHRTLLLRTFYRQFNRVPAGYYALLKGEITSEDLFRRHKKQYRAALRIAKALTLSRRNSKRVDKLVRSALAGHRDKWVLIGGPPCQAYSLVGRARMKAKKSRRFKKDKRHFLYQEYLRILKTLRPPVFVMENVKGLLSSSVAGIEIFDRMLSDFADAGYSVHSFVTPEPADLLEPRDFVIKAECYDVPQTRHRVILLGVRSDVKRNDTVLKNGRRQVSIRSAIGDLPALRSRLSKPAKDTYETWYRELRRQRTIVAKNGAIKGLRGSKAARLQPLPLGAPYINGGPSGPMSGWLKRHSDWLIDNQVKGITLHESRSHMAADLRRYLFSSTFAKRHGRSPKLADFPRRLRPAHKNVKDGVNGGLFSDRFRVQTEGRPGSTVVSHISKDGHYYIHYDPAQCRSLTVREAARLQTFPDNYFFEGNRTAKYAQVGNAVPPLLARQLAAVVHDILGQL